MARKPPPSPPKPHVVMMGSLEHGFSITGPFPSKEEAEEWGRIQERFMPTDRWFATELTPVD